MLASPAKWGFTSSMSKKIPHSDPWIPVHHLGTVNVSAKQFDAFSVIWVRKEGWNIFSTENTMSRWTEYTGMSAKYWKISVGQPRIKYFNTSSGTCGYSGGWILSCLKCLLLFLPKFNILELLFVIMLAWMLAMLTHISKHRSA